MKKYLMSFILLVSSIIGYSQTYLGETSILPAAASVTTRLAWPFIAPATGTLDEISIYYSLSGISAKQFYMAVYDNNISNAPGVLLGVTAELTTTSENRWHTAPLTSVTPTITVGDTIWLSAVFSAGSSVAYSSSNGSIGVNRRASTQTFSSGMPNPFGASSSAAGTASIYAHYTAGLSDYNPVIGRDVKPGYRDVEQKPTIDGKIVYFKKKTPHPITPVFYQLDPLNIGINATIGTEDYDGVCPDGMDRLIDTDCAINDFVYAPLRKLKSSSDYTNIVYIDPSYTGLEMGSLGQPYNSFSDFTIVTNTAYLLKRSTTLTHSEQITISVNNVLIGAYGVGNRPQLKTTSDINTFYITGDGCTIRDLHPQNLFSPKNTTNAHSPFQVSNAVNLDIYNNEIEYAHMGIRTGGGSTGMRIIGNTIHNIYLDGGYFQNQNYTEVAWNNVYNINQSYFDNTDASYSSGDGFQFAGASSQWREAWLHHNNIDRSDEANKADIMFTNSTVDVNDKVIIEYNKLKAPNTDGSGAQAINASGPYLKGIFNNEFTAEDWNTAGLFGGSSGDSIVGNLFTGYNKAYEGGNDVVISHNTFYDNDTAIYRSSGNISKFYNNLFYNNRNEIVGIGVTDSSKNYNQNPSFVDELTKNFMLKSSSNMINKGFTLTYGLYDINGTKRPVGPLRDIGAYEYTTALQDTSKITILFAENFNDLPAGSILKNTITNRWQAVVPNFRENNQSIVSKTPVDKVFRSKYEVGDCTTNQGIEIGIILDSVYRELYMDVNVCYSSNYDTEHTVNNTYGGKSPNGGFWGGNHWNVDNDPWIIDTIGDLHGWAAHNGAGSGTNARLFSYIYEIRTWNKQYNFALTYGGQCHTYTKRVKVNDPGEKNAIVASYVDGVLTQQIDTLWFQSVTQLNSALQNIEGAIIKHSLNNCSDELIYVDIDNIVVYTKGINNPEYVAGAAPTGHIITPLSGTITTNVFQDPILFNETRTSNSGIIKSHYTGGSFHPSTDVSTIYTKSVNNVSGDKYIKFTKWHDGLLNTDAETGMWIKIYSGIGTSGTLLYTFDEDTYNGIPTLNQEYPVPTSFTIEYHPSNDRDLGFSLDYYLQ
jgi:hypothetical protein